MMNYFSSKKKWMAYLILLTFVFTCIVPTNIVGGNSAWADTVVYEPVKQIEQKDIADIPGVTVKVFNYDSTVNTVEGSLGSQGYSFFHGAYGPYKNTGSEEFDDKLGSVDGEGAHASKTDSITNDYNRPVMNATLNEAGYPVTAKGSLGYLFGAHQPFLKGIMNNGGGLFQVDDKDYYYYNSAQNAAYYDSSINKFRLYNINVVPYYNDGDGSGHGGNFLPFNQIEGCVEPFENKTGSGDYDAEKSGPLKNKYRLKVTSPTDNWYGMTVEFKFMMPAGGQWNGKDMVFKFSGDDDVWVYIDNQLVMDMGGTHGVHTGSIDFANGMTTYQHNEDSDGNTSTTKSFSEIYKNAEGKADLSILQEVKDKNGNITSYRFKDYTEHTFKFFYMERGGNISNCSISFNMPISETERTVTKVWDDEENRDGIRPESVEVGLFIDDESIPTTTSSLNFENGWTTTWTQLPKYHGLGDGTDNSKNGKEIVYTIKELDAQGNPIPLAGGQYNEKYTTTYLTTGLETIITNTYEPEKISVEGKKYWDDNNDAAGKRPKEITVNLFSDEKETGKYEKVTEQAVTFDTNWEYSFDNLPKYKNTGVIENGKYKVEEINYRVFEDAILDNGKLIYQPVYDKDSYDITNIYTENATPYVTIGGEKIWQGDEKDLSKRPEKVKVGLFQNNGTNPIATTFTALDWTFYFDEQLRYDDNGKPYVYTVKELDVPEGYISMTEEDRNDTTYDFAFDITNILHTGEVGKVKVKKVVSGDGAPEKFDFMLSVTAKEYNLSDEVKEEQERLELAYQNAVDAEAEAQKDWNEAVGLFKEHAGAYSTSSAYQFVMVRKTSPSAYQFTMLDKDNRMEVTTSSAMTLFDGVSELSNSDSILETVANAIGSLADEFKDAASSASLFLKSLKEALGDTIDAAVEFNTKDAQVLLDAQNRLFDAKVRVDATSSAVYEFVNSNTTPSAVTIITKDGAGVEETHNMTLDKLSDVDTYRLYFSLKNNQEYAATILAAEGVELDYTVVELLKDADRTNYEKTIVDLNGSKVGEFTTGNPSYAENLTDAEVADLVFTNYYDVDDPWTPTTPDPKDPPPPPEKTNPDTTIPDENIPTGSVEPGEPLDELEDPEIPLGDAPATGDTNNAAPFMALLLAAIAGLVITRRKFN